MSTISSARTVLISQHYSRNKGNVSLLYAFVESLKQRFSQVRIVVGSFEPEETHELFGYECCEWPFRTRAMADAHGVWKVILGVMQIGSLASQIVLAVLLRCRLIRPSWLRGPFAPLRIIAESDLVVSPGGHLFTSLNHFVGVWAHFTPCLLATLVGTPYAVVAQTLGPCYGMWRRPSIWLIRFLVYEYVFPLLR